MHWLQSIDTALFHFINGSLGNPVFDWLMPRLSGGDGVMRWFSLAAVVTFVVTLVRGGTRARLCALLLLIVIAAGDPLVIGTIRNAVGRPRPCLALSDVVERLGCSGSGSMPSAHAANWFAAAMVVFLFYRRSAWFMFPLAASVAFSRVYCGVHYPSDVTAGAILGAGYAVALVIAAQALWNFLGKKLFPAWHEKMPSLLHPEHRAQNPEPFSAAIRNPKSEMEWLHLGQLVIIVALVARWLYIASGIIGLSGDEAYQWLWSKHLALSYFSKPPGIAYIQWAGTALGGDTELGVRFFSPVFGAILSWLILNFMAREIGGRRAFVLLLLTFATPLLVAGSVLMTIDPPLVLCWMWAVIAGWRAVQPEGRTRDWLIVGLATALGFLCKYSALFLPVCFGIYFALQPSARAHLRKSGPWLALGLLALGTLPVLIWNAQHDWATVHHVAGNAGLVGKWRPNGRYFLDFLGAQAGLLNPVFFVGMMWACFGFWKKRKEKPLQLFLFCAGAPVFFGYWLYTLHSHVLPNWIAPAVPPLFCLMALYWTEHRVRLQPWLVASLVFGLLASAFMYDSDLLSKVVAKLPGEADPSHRVRGWRETAQVVEAERAKFDPGAFVIADDYGTASLLTFYSPPARAAAIAGKPLVYCLDDDELVNQFPFWDEYNYCNHRSGQNAIFVRHLESYPLESGWIWKWLRHEPVHYGKIPRLRVFQPRLAAEFEVVTNLGVRDILLPDGRTFQRVQIIGCYNLR
jgi:membrane-associated phospholipid phosphatase